MFPLEDPINCLVPDNLKEPISGSKTGHLAGLNFMAKDLFDVIGHKTSNGSPEFHKYAQASTVNAKAITQLLNSGATLVGMNICDEFFYSLTGANKHYGTPINCKAPERLPGGSSSGSAAAVAAGIVDFSIGSDTGGSVRIPSSFCGIWGIRPTIGRVSLDGARAMAPSFDTVGWFSSKTNLMPIIGHSLLKGKRENTPINRVIVAKDAVDNSDPGVQLAFTNFTEEILGKDIQQITVSSEGLDKWWETFRIIQAGEVKITNLPWVREHNPSLDPGIDKRFQTAEAITDSEFNEALKKRNEIKEHIDKIIPPGTVLVFPTAPCIAPLKQADSKTLELFRAKTMALTCIAGLGGFPQVSMPALTVKDCPVGVSFLGSTGMDENILELTQTFSKQSGLP